MVKGPGLGIAESYLLSLLDGTMEDTLEKARKLLEGLREM
jgi:hypothetical protein